MKAMVLDAPGQLLQYRSIPDPVAAPGQVLVKVSACGVCRTDLHVVDGELTDPRLPIIPGHEIVGCVAAIGTGVNRFAVGDRVGPHPAMARRRQRGQLGEEAAVGAEQLLGPITPHPGLERLEVAGVVVRLRERHLHADLLGHEPGPVV